MPLSSYRGPLVAPTGGLLAAGPEAHSAGRADSWGTGMGEKIVSPWSAQTLHKVQPQWSS